jgi:predicted metal-binding protein
MEPTMTEILTQIARWALDGGATHALPVTDRAYLVAQEYVREACLQNACGHSGRCWTCPPHVGEFADLAARLLAYPGVLLVQSITPLADSWDFEAMTAAAEAHNTLLRTLGQRAAAAFPACDILALGCGGCGFCPTCTCPDAPCRFPEEALASVEGYGLDVKALVESVGLHYINGKNTVSFVGAVLVSCPA